MRQAFVTAIGKLSVFLGKATGPFYLGAIGLSVYEVFTRYVLNDPTAWTTEAVMGLCATGWMLSVGAVTQQHRHITVTVMELVVGKTIWNRMRKLALVLSLTAVAGLSWANWGPMTRAVAHIERTGSAFNPPLISYLKVMLSVVAVVYFLQLLANLLDRFDKGHDHGTSQSDPTVDTRD